MMKNIPTGAMIKPAMNEVDVPRFRMVIDMVDSNTATFIHWRNVRSLAKNTLGSTRTAACWGVGTPLGPPPPPPPTPGPPGPGGPPGLPSMRGRRLVQKSGHHRLLAGLCSSRASLSRVGRLGGRCSPPPPAAAAVAAAGRAAFGGNAARSPLSRGSESSPPTSTDLGGGGGSGRAMSASGDWSAWATPLADALAPPLSPDAKRLMWSAISWNEVFSCISRALSPTPMTSTWC
mmetsp:Transcript_31189/g.90504  ORF Transcript_31189/g.90504 Transcript_31189/m.90504 type:complete len:233 (-) Transcript_31189:818-1516(-)